MFQTSPVSCGVIRKSLAAGVERAALAPIHVRFSTLRGSSSNAGDATAKSPRGGNGGRGSHRLPPVPPSLTAGPLLKGTLDPMQ